jgi:hypothetical protein
MQAPSSIATRKVAGLEHLKHFNSLGFIAMIDCIFGIGFLAYFLRVTLISFYEMESTWLFKSPKSWAIPLHSQHGSITGSWLLSARILSCAAWFRLNAARLFIFISRK